MLDRDAWITMHAAIWGGRDWANGELLRISGATAGRNDFGSRGVVEAGDAAGAWSVIQRFGTRQSMYAQVGVQHASARGIKGRGKKADVAALPALVVDLDVKGGVHSAGDRNPTLEEALGWVDEYPLGRPSVLVHTGGGLHAWYALTQPLDPTTELSAEVLTRHKAWWTAVAARDDRNIDAGVLADLTRVLRAAGTLNFKGKSPQPVRVQELNDGRVEISDVLSLLPPVPGKTRRSVLPWGRSTRNPRQRTAPTGEHARDRFNAAVSLEDLLADVFDAELRPARGVSLPDATGSVPDRDAGRIFVGDWGESRVTWFSTTVQAGFHLDSEVHSHGAFEVLAAGAGGGRVGVLRVERMVSAWEGAWDTSDFVLAARALLTPHCRAAFAIEFENPPLPPKGAGRAARSPQGREEPPAASETASARTPASHTMTPPVGAEITAEPSTPEERRRAIFQALLGPAVVAEVTTPASNTALHVEVPSAAEPEPEVAPAPQPIPAEPFKFTVETGGGAVRVRCHDVEQVAPYIVSEGLGTWRVVGPEIVQLLDVPPAETDRAITALRRLDPDASVTDYDASAEGCEIRCYSRRPVEKAPDGEWRCPEHSDAPGRYRAEATR